MTSEGDEEPNQRWLARAKFDLPLQQVRQVDRSYLLDRFSGKRLGLIVAPAGFGKSVLLSQWCQRQLTEGSCVAWVSLDEADAEPMQFMSYLIVALAEAGLSLGPLVPLAERGLVENDLRSVVSGLFELIAGSRRSVVLVLDDYHRVAGRPVDRVMAKLLAAAPHNLTILVSSRAQPDLDLARLVATGNAAEIRADELRIPRSAMDAILPVALDQAALDLLHAKTEGWAVAIQLAGYLLQSVGDGRALLEAFKGDTGHIAGFLTEQVLRTISAEQRLFLLQTSILERFDAALADAVTERTDSRAMLEQLAYLNALLVPLGEPAGWFRYHHLFADYLQSQLHRDFPDDVAERHLNASIWFEKSGDLTNAVLHARKAGDLPRCAELIEHAGGWSLILFGGIGYLRNLLRNIPPEQMASFPRTQVAQAYLHVKDGRLYEARSAIDEAAATSSGGAGDERLAWDLLNVGALLAGYEDVRSLAAFNKLAATIAKRHSADALTIGVLACDQSLAAMALGKIAEADACAQEAMRAMRRARSALGLAYSTMHAGLAAFYQGRFHAAEAHLGAACRIAAENMAFDPGLTAQSNLLMATLHYWRGPLGDDARSSFLSDMEQIEAHDGWFELYANGLEVECGSAMDWSEGVTRARRIAADRGLKRLDLLADAYELTRSAGREAEAAAKKLLTALPDQIWRRDPFQWRPYVVSRMAVASQVQDRDRSAAIRAIDDAISCCRSAGATIFLIDALAVRASLLDRSGDRQAALSDLIEALSMAAPEGIARPFLGRRGITPLLHAIIKGAKRELVDRTVSSFARSILSKNPVPVPALRHVADKDALSPREQEVLTELASGATNKEIARSLGMTEDGVKFHLKRIFAKLKVDSRSKAIALTQPGGGEAVVAGSWDK